MPSFIGFIPTSVDDIDGFFELAPVSSSDVVYDLGSGDGRLLFAALDKGAGTAVGIELNARLVSIAREMAKGKNIKDRVTFLEADLMDVSLAEATLVFCYLSPKASVALKPKLEAELRPGTRVVTETFNVPGWKPSQTTNRDGMLFYLYTIPADITDGTQP